jgi:NAD(P)H-flavin reductase
MPDIYTPDLMEVVGVRRHTPDVKSVRIRFQSQERASRFDFRVGQFGIFSAFGYGESTFNICSSSNWKDSLEFCFRKVGCVTEALWRVEEGDTIGFRGPYGNGYPIENWEGKNLIFLGGGIAMPPIRCAVWYALENRAKYGDITIVYGARTVADLVYVNELEEWAMRDRVRVIQCVDPGGQTAEWKGEVGFVPTVFERAKVAAENSVVLVIGPPIMIKNTLPILERLGIGADSVYTSLENRM